MTSLTIYSRGREWVGSWIPPWAFQDGRVGGIGELGGRQKWRLKWDTEGETSVSLSDQRAGGLCSPEDWVLRASLLLGGVRGALRARGLVQGPCVPLWNPRQGWKVCVRNRAVWKAREVPTRGPAGTPLSLPPPPLPPFPQILTLLFSHMPSGFLVFLISHLFCLFQLQLKPSFIPFSSRLSSLFVSLLKTEQVTHGLNSKQRPSVVSSRPPKWPVAYVIVSSGFPHPGVFNFSWWICLFLSFPVSVLRSRPTACGAHSPHEPSCQAPGAGAQ